MIYNIKTERFEKPSTLCKFFNMQTKEEETLEKLKSYLLEICDWDKVFSVVNNLPIKYDDRELRFDKSSIIECSLEEYSKGKLKKVNGIGFDFLVQDIDSEFHDKKIELKTGKNIISYKDSFIIKHKRGQTDPKTSSITLKNTQGSSDRQNYTKKHDFLLILDRCAAAITTFERVSPYVKSRGDCFTAIIPLSELEIVCKVNVKNIFIKEINLEDRRKKYCLDVIRDING